MPDTGAPWNIPFAEGSDLVRDWPALSEDVADAVADGLNTRKFGQIAQTVKTDTFTTTSSTYVVVTGLEVSITPSSASNKVLVMISVPFAFAGAGAGGQPEGHMSIFRDTTNLSVPTSPGDRTPVTHSTAVQSFNFSFLDSPATTSAVTYSVRVRGPGGDPTPVVYVNRSVDDSDATGRARGISTITAIEVAA
jgi:hypothetical protein